MEIWGQTPNSSLCSLCLCGDFSSIFPRRNGGVLCYEEVAQICKEISNLGH